MNILESGNDVTSKIKNTSRGRKPMRMLVFKKPQLFKKVRKALHRTH